MRVFISADLEGITGIVQQRQIDVDGPDYGRSRRLMTGDVNAAVEGATAAGAEFVLVNDSHASKLNILIEELNPRATLISGSTKPLGMVEGINDTYDAAVLIGYHAKAGTAQAVADHTSNPTIFDVLLNGVSVGELGLNAALIAHFGVPVVAVSGDVAVTEEAKALLGNVETAVVKWAHGRFSAECLPPSVAKGLIKQAVTRALRGLESYRPYEISLPLKLETTFVTSEMADQAEMVPGVRRTSARSALIEADSFLEAYMAWRAMLFTAAVPIW